MDQRAIGFGRIKSGVSKEGIRVEIGMKREEISIINKRDVSHNTEAVGKNGKFVSIAEMTVDVHLPC